MQQLSGMDYMFFGFESDENPVHIAGVSICDPATAPDGKVNAKKVRKLICERLESLPMVRRRLHRVPLNLDYPYWVEDEDFDLDFHVRLVRLPKPGSWTQLMEKMAQLINEPFEPDRPPWELYVFEGINKAPDLSPGSFALFLRMHHVFADAASSMIINDVMYDDSQYSGETVADWESPPGNARMLGSALVNSANRTFGSGLGLLRATPHIARYLADAIGSAMRERTSPLDGMVPPRSLLNPERLTDERLADARRFDFNRVRQMRQLVDGSTINDLLLAVIGGGIRRYLAGRDGRITETLTTMVPINLRQFDDNNDGSNVVSGMMLPLHQEIEDPVERLAAIHKASSRAKRENAMEVNRRVVGVLTGMPSPVLSVTLAALNKLAYSGQSVTASTIISNARSYSDIRYVAGAEVKYAFGVGMLGPGIGSLHACTVYAGYMNIGLTCTPEAIPDTGEYMRCLEESFAEYDGLVTARKA